MWLEITVYIGQIIRVLLHFSLSVKAVTLIFISGRDLAISSAHEGKQVILTVKQKI